MNKTILVYAHWSSMPQPEQVGRLEIDLVRGTETYRFTYAESWLSSPFPTQIDPQLQLFAGDQFNDAPHDYSNELNLDLALEVAGYFQLSDLQAKQILLEVKAVTNKWRNYAKKIGISRPEQQMLESVFRSF